jgi:hypothetical protein
MTNNVIMLPATPEARRERLVDQLAALDPSELTDAYYEAAWRRYQEDRMAAFDAAFDDIAESRLDSDGRMVLTTLCFYAMKEPHHGPRREQIAGSCEMSVATLARHLRKIRGQTCAGLGIRPEPIRELAVWLLEFIDTGKTMWRPVYV